MTHAASKRLLIVDDDPGIRRQLEWAFEGFDTTACGNREALGKALEADPPAVVLLDLGLPPDPDGPSEGLAALKDVLQAAPAAKVVIMTGQKERAHAVRSIALGAYDFYEKPLDLGELELIVSRASRLYDLERENRELQARAGRSEIPGLITASPALRQAGTQTARLARTDVAVLIIGESGTGKELLARAVHTLSGRGKGPYVAINCAAIPETLLESELFGHEKGAFTGAHKTTVGKFEQAHGGTLLLDEIGDLPLSLQAKLLRVLQERTIERVGGRKSIAVDFRLVCATNRNLREAIAEGAFRSDLYYRLGEAEVEIPPLRERPEDAILIAQRFLETWTAEQGLSGLSFSGDALAAISQYQWPGNVRELQSRIKRAAACASGKMTASDLGLVVEDDTLSLRKARQRAEREVLRRALTQADGNISEAARLLEISRPTLYQLMNEHDMR